jgi:CBS domain-containing protein
MAKIENHFSRDLVALDARVSSREAARCMRDRKIGAVVVRDQDRTIGLVTERDLTWRVLGGDGPVDLPLVDVVRKDLPAVTPVSTETECSHLMRTHNTRHLMVADKGEVVGIISMRDVIQLMLDEKQWMIEQLQRYVYQT